MVAGLVNTLQRDHSNLMDHQHDYHKFPGRRWQELAPILISEIKVADVDACKHVHPPPPPPPPSPVLSAVSAIFNLHPEVFKLCLLQ